MTFDFLQDVIKDDTTRIIVYAIIIGALAYFIYSFFKKEEKTEGYKDNLPTLFGIERDSDEYGQNFTKNPTPNSLFVGTNSSYPGSFQGHLPRTETMKQIYPPGKATTNEEFNQLENIKQERTKNYLRGDKPIGYTHQEKTKKEDLFDNPIIQDRALAGRKYLTEGRRQYKKETLKDDVRDNSLKAALVQHGKNVKQIKGLSGISDKKIKSNPGGEVARRVRAMQEI
ncbi:MAG: hypothetical protein ACOCRK_04345 [bacterium]